MAFTAWTSGKSLKLSTDWLLFLKLALEAESSKFLDLTSISILSLNFCKVDLLKFLYRKHLSNKIDGETGISLQKWIKAPTNPRFLIDPLHPDRLLWILLVKMLIRAQQIRYRTFSPSTKNESKIRTYFSKKNIHYFVGVSKKKTRLPSEEMAASRISTMSIGERDLRVLPWTIPLAKSWCICGRLFDTIRKQLSIRLRIPTCFARQIWCSLMTRRS